MMIIMKRRHNRAFCVWVNVEASQGLEAEPGKRREGCLNRMDG